MHWTQDPKNRNKIMNAAARDTFERAVYRERALRGKAEGGHTDVNYETPRSE
jgi:hypothetical protein